LVDAQGNSLYVFLADTPTQSNCNGACAQVWPPLTTASGQTPTGANGVQSSLIGTITRSDGSTQITYNGYPLYKYAGDAAPGATNGQGLNQFGALWFLLQPSGQPLT
jgi:predicted lipoprotein with Yx(FWY)xxD motif